MNTSKDPFILNLEFEIGEKKKEILENLNYFLSKNGFVRELVQNIYDLEQKIIKSKKDKEIRIILSSFLALIFLYKEELEKNSLLEKDFEEVLQEKEYFKKRVEEIALSLHEDGKALENRIQFLENESSFLKQENEILLQEKEHLEQEIGNLIEAIAKIDGEKRKLENMLGKIRKHISQIVNEKIKKEYKKYLKKLEKQIRKGLDNEFKVKKAFLERKLNEQLGEIRLELSNLKIENGSLKKDLEEKEKIIGELISKLSKVTIEKAGSLLKEVREIISGNDDKKEQIIQLQKENERLRLELEKLEEEKLLLQEKNNQLKEENSRLNDINSSLISSAMKAYKINS